MFGSLNTESSTGKAMLVVYALCLVVMIWLWIRLLMGKREPEKGPAILMLALAGASLISLVIALCAVPIDPWSVIEAAVFTGLYALMGATELLFLRKKNNTHDGLE